MFMIMFTYYLNDSSKHIVDLETVSPNRARSKRVYILHPFLNVKPPIGGSAPDRGQNNTSDQHRLLHSPRFERPPIGGVEEGVARVQAHRLVRTGMQWREVG